MEKKMRKRVLIIITIFIAMAILCCCGSTSSNVKQWHKAYMEDSDQSWNDCSAVDNLGLLMASKHEYDNGTAEEFIREYCETYSLEEFLISLHQICDVARQYPSQYNVNNLGSLASLIFNMPEYASEKITVSKDSIEQLHGADGYYYGLTDKENTETVSGSFNVGTSNEIKEDYKTNISIIKYYGDWAIEYIDKYDYSEGNYGWVGSIFVDEKPSWIHDEGFILYYKGAQVDKNESGSFNKTFYMINHTGDDENSSNSQSHCTVFYLEDKEYMDNYLQYTTINNEHDRYADYSYERAVASMQAGDYDNAIETFEPIMSYKDSEELWKECHSLAAKELLNDYIDSEASSIALEEYYAFTEKLHNYIEPIIGYDEMLDGYYTQLQKRVIGEAFSSNYYAYNEYGSLIKNNFSLYKYDDEGKLIHSERVENSGNRRNFVYNSEGILTSIESYSDRISYVINEKGQIIQYIFQGNTILSITTYNYNEAGQLVEIIGGDLYDGHYRTQYTYNAEGNIETEIVTYIYGSHSSTPGKETPDYTVTYSYEDDLVRKTTKYPSNSYNDKKSGDTETKDYIIGWVLVSANNDKATIFDALTPVDYYNN